MARTTLSVQTVQQAGIEATFVAANTDGVSVNNNGNTYIEIINAHTSATCTVTVEHPGEIDGLAVATGCYIGRRSMRVLDFGKVAATFIDTQTGQAVRIVPSAHSRQLAKTYAPQAQSRWHAYLHGYQRMPNEELLTVQEVTLDVSLAEILSKDGYRVNCDICGEEIINEREVRHEGLILCRPCAGARYYRLSGESVPVFAPAIR